MDSCLDLNPVWGSCPDGKVCNPDTGECDYNVPIVGSNTCSWSFSFDEGEVCPKSSIGYDSTFMIEYCCWDGTGIGPWCADFNYYAPREVCENECVSDYYRGYNGVQKDCTDLGWSNCEWVFENCDVSPYSYYANTGTPYTCCSEDGQSSCTCQDQVKMEGYCNPSTAACDTRVSQETRIVRTNCASCGTDSCDSFKSKNYYCESGVCAYESACSLACGASCVTSATCSCPSDGCYNNDYYDYPDHGYCTAACTCFLGGTYCEPTITDCECGSCSESGCQLNCSGADSSCGCETCQNCDASDGWQETGVSYACCSGDQSCTCFEQTYCDYSCVGTYCGAACSDSSIDYRNCSLIDGQCGYSSNHPPNQPTIPPDYLPDGITWNNCTFQDKSIPTFNWSDFSDPDPGDYMTAYEIEVDENAGFGHPKFNHAVNFSSVVYTLDLYQDDEDPDNLPVSMQDHELDWNATYFWRVRVKDSKGAWSSWSQTKEFKTLQSSAPYPGFTWEPPEPNINEVVAFTPLETDALSYSWIFTPCRNQDECYEPLTAATQQPELKLLYPLYKVELTVTNDQESCSKEEDITVWYPLPKYKEVAPSLFFDAGRIFLALADFFKGSFYVK
jgi:hypothetical protein